MSSVLREMTNTPPAMRLSLMRKPTSTRPAAQDDAMDAEPPLSFKPTTKQPVAKKRNGKQQQLPQQASEADQLCKSLSPQQQPWQDVKADLLALAELMRQDRVTGQALTRLGVPLSHWLKSGLSQLALPACQCVEQACKVLAVSSRVGKAEFADFALRVLEPVCHVASSLTSGTKQAQELAAKCLLGLYLASDELQVDYAMDILGASKNNAARRQACALVFSLACMEENDGEEEDVRGDALAAATVRFLVDTDGETRSTARTCLAAFMQNRALAWVELHILDKLRDTEAAQVTLKQFAHEFPSLGLELGLDPVPPMRASFAGQQQQRASLRTVPTPATPQWTYESPLKSRMTSSAAARALATTGNGAVESSPFGEMLLLKRRQNRQLASEFNELEEEEELRTPAPAAMEAGEGGFFTPAVGPLTEFETPAETPLVEEEQEVEQEEEEDVVKPSWPETEEITPIALNFQSKGVVELAVVVEETAPAVRWRVPRWVKLVVSVLAIGVVYVLHHRHDLLEGTCDDYHSMVATTTTTIAIPALPIVHEEKPVAVEVVAEEEAPPVDVAAEVEEPVTIEEEEEPVANEEVPMVEEVPVVEEEEPIVEEEAPIAEEDEAVVEEEELIAEEDEPVVEEEEPIVEEEPVLATIVVEEEVEQEQVALATTPSSPVTGFLPLLAAMAFLGYMVFTPPSPSADGNNNDNQW